MAHEGIGGELRLADFDVLDLSNLNRVAAASPTSA
jgi:molybdopterin/thiamine biosynthesis adenylyltransferase